jgi:hypothetical protein
LARDGVIARQRRPGAVYAYTIAARFLPAQRGVSHPCEQKNRKLRKQGLAPDSLDQG